MRILISILFLLSPPILFASEPSKFNGGVVESENSPDSLPAQKQNNFSAKTIELKNTFNFFIQDIRTGMSLPKSLSPQQKLDISIELPTDLIDPSLRKVYNIDIKFQDLIAKLEVYYFLRNQESYLSQQVTFLKGSEIIGRCTSYFALTQQFLVPGVCSGAKDGFLWGISIYRAP